MWGRPGHGEACAACDGVIAKDELVIEGMPLVAGRPPMRLHVECFYLCEQVRHALMGPGT